MNVKVNVYTESLQFSNVHNHKVLTIYEPCRNNLFLPYANNHGADQPAHPHSLISAFIVRYQDSIIYVIASAEIPGL